MTPPPRYPVALFDLDGTLCDPGTGIADAVRHGLAQIGLREDDDAVLAGFIGPPLEHSLRDRYGLPPAQVALVVDAYREHYVAQGIAEYRPYPGIPDLLRRLAEQGVRLGVVTAKAQAIAEQALRETGLVEWFEHVAGRDPNVVVEKTVTLRHALATLRCPPNEVVMIGDREHDVLAARDNGIDSIGVLYGYGSRDELAAAGATHLAESPASVEAVVLGRAAASRTVPPMTDGFVPAGFEPPTSLATDSFRLEPLGPQHNDADHAAWTSSIEHIRATPGFPDGTWPPPGGMTLERNLADLRRHADDFEQRKGFTFTVLDPADDDVIGCVYLYPSPSEEWDVIAQSWVRADHADLDGPLADAVATWLEADWPWERVDRCGR